jgi:hypothetical protein
MVSAKKIPELTRKSLTTRLEVVSLYTYILLLLFLINVYSFWVQRFNTGGPYIRGGSLLPDTLHQKHTLLTDF